MRVYAWIGWSNRPRLGELLIELWNRTQRDLLNLSHLRRVFGFDLIEHPHFA